MSSLYRFIHLPVVRGVQLSQGLQFAFSAIEYVRYTTLLLGNQAFQKLQQPNASSTEQIFEKQEKGKCSLHSREIAKQVNNIEKAEIIMAGASSSSFFAGIMEEDQNCTHQHIQYSSSNTSTTTTPPQRSKKKKRNLPGTPDPNAEIIALSPKSLMARNNFVCEVCHKGFQREQNLQLHRRGHNLPWKLKSKNASKDATDGDQSMAKRKMYVCPDPSCVHHNPSRALGDLTGIKKHYCRKHGKKTFKCDRCSKTYAVQSDVKAHFKLCGTKEYRCHCGNIFNRRDSYITHKAFCEALAKEVAKYPSAFTKYFFGNSSSTNRVLSPTEISSNRLSLLPESNVNPSPSVQINSIPYQSQFVPPHDNSTQQYQEPNNSIVQNNSFLGFMQQLPDLPVSNSTPPSSFTNLDFFSANKYYFGNNVNNMSIFMDYDNTIAGNIGCSSRGMHLFCNDNIYHSQNSSNSSHLSATALLQKAVRIGSTTSNSSARSYDSHFQGLAVSFANVGSGAMYSIDQVDTRFCGFSDDSMQLHNKKFGMSIVDDFLGVGEGSILSSNTDVGILSSQSYDNIGK